MNTSRQQGFFVVMERWGVGTKREESQAYKQRGRERRGRCKQDCKIVIIAYTNEKLITPQLAEQTVLLKAGRRGQHISIS